jgi:hypothetical protein
MLGLGGGDIRPVHIEQVLKDMASRDKAEAPMVLEVG